MWNIGTFTNPCWPPFFKRSTLGDQTCQALNLVESSGTGGVGGDNSGKWPFCIRQMIHSLGEHEPLIELLNCFPLTQAYTYFFQIATVHSYVLNCQRVQHKSGTGSGNVCLRTTSQQNALRTECRLGPQQLSKWDSGSSQVAQEKSWNIPGLSLEFWSIQSS